jgi:hypothetical protein
MSWRVVGEIVDPTVLVRTTLNGFSKPWENFVRGIVARETMPSWERLWDDFVQEELRHGSTSTSQQQGVGDGDEGDLAFVAQGKKKTGQGPKGGAKQQQPRGGEQKKDMSKVKCFACGEMGHYAGQCPKKKKKQGGTAATTDEEEFTAQFERECAFIVCCLTVETPSNSWCVDRVEEVPQIQSVAAQGTQTQLSSTPYSGVTGPPGTTSVSELPSIQTVGADASGSQTTLQRSVDETQRHEETTQPEVTSGKRKPRWFQETLKEPKEYVGEPQRLIRESRAPERFGSHLAMETSISVSDSTFDDQVTTILTESLPTGKDVHFRDKIGGVSDTFLGKREC